MFTETPPSPLVETGEATAILPVQDGRFTPITVIGTPAIRATFDEGCLKQALNARTSPGVTDVVLNPDAHLGYGAPIGCVMASPTHIYPGPVGVDIKCSMSLLQLNIPQDVINDKSTRRAIINAITDRTPTGAGRGYRAARKGRPISRALGREVVINGASELVCAELGVPFYWASRCEDAFHRGHDGTVDSLARRVDEFTSEKEGDDRFAGKMKQLGTYGGGNHFGECEVVNIMESEYARSTAASFGLRDGHVAFLSHCGSRGWGAILADRQFRSLRQHFAKWEIPLPGGDRDMVYAPLGSQEANAYIDDMSMGANFATVNHLLINALVLEAFQEVLPGTTGDLVYFISHNIAREEEVRGVKSWVHRKGATRAFPAQHPGLAGTPFFETGHPILLPGNPRDGSSVMVGQPGAQASLYSVNHGAGRMMSRTKAIKTLNQRAVDQELADADIMTNCRTYPLDESPDAYKDFNEVLRSVELAGLARQVARLKARFVIKDGDKADD
jgi:tRNA-splicing ligase RtcB